MAIALDHLRRHWRRLQSKPRADALFVLRLQMAKRPDRSRELSHAHVFRRRIEANDVALNLRVPVQQLQSKRRWLGMNTMRAPNRRRVFELDGPPLQHL